MERKSGCCSRTCASKCPATRKVETVVKPKNEVPETIKKETDKQVRAPVTVKAGKDATSIKKEPATPKVETVVKPKNEVPETIKKETDKQVCAPVTVKAEGKDAISIKKEPVKVTISGGAVGGGSS